jgi:hypothetical protein
MAKGPGKGKTNNLNGRPKGTPNKTTQEAKKMLEQLLFGRISSINDALDNLQQEDSGKYLDAVSKLFTYVLPKKTDVTSDDKPLKIVKISFKHE